MEHTKISTDIEQNIKQFQQLFADSADIKMKEMHLSALHHQVFIQTVFHL